MAPLSILPWRVEMTFICSSGQCSQTRPRQHLDWSHYMNIQECGAELLHPYTYEIFSHVVIISGLLGIYFVHGLCSAAY